MDPGVYGKETRQEKVERYIPLVRRIAYHFQLRVPASVDVDDLIQAGFVGLLDALDKIADPEMEPRFESYASLRIRGAILDALRSLDPVPRRTRAKLRKAQLAVTELEQTLGRPPTEEQIASRLGLSLSDYHVLLRDANAAQIVYFDDVSAAGAALSAALQLNPGTDPLATLERDNLQEELTKAIERLPDRERLALSLYYQEELNLKEIGKILGVSESRVSQILRQASLRLRGNIVA